jgi:hypothetical protein
MPKKYLDFVIGVDDEGAEISFTSDPSKLANHFGANPGAPNYLTPVSFRKNVLENYFAQPRVCTQLVVAACSVA